MKPPVPIIHQHVPYVSRSARKNVSPGLHKSKVRFLDLEFLELHLKLASFEATSCEEECPGRVLGE